MNKVEQRKALAAAVAAAKAVGQLMRQNLRQTKRVNAETSHDIKLELDVRCQKLIERRLHRAFPKVALLGEEGDSGSPNAAARWVVDPIDGTVNFAYGIPHACVSIALQVRSPESGVQGPESKVQRPRSKGPTHHASRITDYASRITPYVTLIGVVYDPFTDELWTAIRGEPARLNGTVIRPSARRHLREAVVSIGFSKSRHAMEKTLPYFIWLARRVRKIRMLGAASLGLTYVATGRLDAYIERGINLWDVAAGGLIIECAGGKFCIEPLAGQTNRFRMIASNGLVHDKLPMPR